jgi:hypothetical protein
VFGWTTETFDTTRLPGRARAQGPAPGTIPLFYASGPSSRRGERRAVGEPGRGLVEEAQQFHRERQHERRILLCGDFDDRLEQPQLQGRRRFRHDVRGGRQFLRRLELPIRGDDAGAALAFGLGLPGHRPLHRLWQGDILDLHPVDFYAPPNSRAVQHQCQALVERLTVRQQVIQVAFTDDRPE